MAELAVQEKDSTMKIGYPCINRTIRCKGDRTFRLKSYSERRLIDTVTNNLGCLLGILKFNVEHHILFFRITSDLVPFASHPICQFDWPSYFKDQLLSIGTYIRSHDIRISMHPGQYTILNTPDGRVLETSIKELQYHADLIDALGLDASAKIQIHVGGIYGHKDESIRRFIERYRSLDEAIRRILVIENDDRSYTVDDCMRIHMQTGVPILFDVFHHELNCSGSSSTDALADITKTWQIYDGIPMVDYSGQQVGGLKVSHMESIDASHFQHFLIATQRFDFDLMLEIKDKEMSALKAVGIARKDERFFKG